MPLAASPLPTARNCSSVMPSQNQRRPTVTLNRALGNRRRNSQRTAWAAGIAMNPSGSASARQPIKLRRPMPGSIRMATVPALNEAKASEMKSMPGRTSKAIRVPGVAPSTCSPRAIRSLSSSSCRKVTCRYRRLPWRRSRAVRPQPPRRASPEPSQRAASQRSLSRP